MDAGRSTACSLRLGRCATRPVAMLISVALRERHGLPSSTWCPKGFPPSEDTGLFRRRPKALQGIGYEAMAAHQLEAAAVIAAEPQRGSSRNLVGTGPGGSMPAAARAAWSRPEAARTTAAQRRPDHGGAAAEAGRGCPASVCFCTNPPADSRGRPATHAAIYQYAADQHRTEGALRTWRRSFEAAMRALPGLHGRVERPADERTRRSTSGWIADRIARAGPHGRPGRSRRCPTPTARARVSTDLRAQQPVRVVMRVAPQFQQQSGTRCRTAPHEGVERPRWFRCRPWRRSRPASGRVR